MSLYSLKVTALVVLTPRSNLGSERMSRAVSVGVLDAMVMEQGCGAAKA